MADHTKAGSWAGQGLTIAQVTRGLGLTISKVQPSNFVPMLKYTQFAIFTNGISMCFMKVGIGLSLLRLNLSKPLNWAVVGCIILSLLVNLIVFPGVFGQCQPMNKLWDPSVEGTCWPERASLAFAYTQTGMYRLVHHASVFGLISFSWKHPDRFCLHFWALVLPFQSQGFAVQQMGTSRRLPHRFAVSLARLVMSFFF